jgi:hypothetical protein
LHFPADLFGVEKMYVRTGTWADGIPKYSAVRGSSPLEGYHRHLALILSGANNSAELAQGLLTEHKHEWNMNARINKRGQNDYGLIDTKPIKSIKAACARLGLADPYPEYVTLTFEPKERFGFDALSPGKGPLLGVSLKEQTANEVPIVEDDGGASVFKDDASGEWSREVMLSRLFCLPCRCLPGDSVSLPSSKEKQNHDFSSNEIIFHA